MRVDETVDPAQFRDEVLKTLRKNFGKYINTKEDNIQITTERGRIVGKVRPNANAGEVLLKVNWKVAPEEMLEEMKKIAKYLTDNMSIVEQVSINDPETGYIVYKSNTDFYNVDRTREIGKPSTEVKSDTDRTDNLVSKSQGISGRKGKTAADQVLQKAAENPRKQWDDATKEKFKELKDRWEKKHGISVPTEDDLNKQFYDEVRKRIEFRRTRDDLVMVPYFIWKSQRLGDRVDDPYTIYLPKEKSVMTSKEALDNVKLGIKYQYKWDQSKRSWIMYNATDPKMRECRSSEMLSIVRSL